jgi:hypothetical protein
MVEPKERRERMEQEQTHAALQRLRELAQSDNEQVALKAAVELLNREPKEPQTEEKDGIWVLKGP